MNNKIEKYLTITEASGMVVKMAGKQVTAIENLRSIISEIEYFNSDVMLGWDSDIKKVKKAVDAADGLLAKLLVKYNKATV
jgi:hypothetical protein